MADAHELIAEMRVSLAIGQRVRHTDYKRQRVTGVVHQLTIDAERGLMVTVLLDEPIVIPPVDVGDHDLLLHWQTAQAHEFAPFDERDELIESLLGALQAEEEWRGRDAVGELDPEWDYELMVGTKRRAAIASATKGSVHG